MTNSPEIKFCENCVDVRAPNGKLLGHFNKWICGARRLVFPFTDGNREFDLKQFAWSDVRDGEVKAVEIRMAILVDDVDLLRRLPSFREPGETFSCGEPAEWPEEMAA